MKSEYNRLTVDVIGGALALWSGCLEQICPDGITPFMAPTARSGP